MPIYRWMSLGDGGWLAEPIPAEKGKSAASNHDGGVCPIISSGYAASRCDAARRFVCSWKIELRAYKKACRSISRPLSLSLATPIARPLQLQGRSAVALRAAESLRKVDPPYP